MGRLRVILASEGLIKVAGHEKGLDESKPVTMSGLKGMNSKPGSKKFKNFAAYEKWLESEDAENWTVQQVHNT